MHPCSKRKSLKALYLSSMQYEMNFRFFRLMLIGLVMILVTAACAPQTATPPPVDNLATNVASGVSSVLTLTAGAPTPLPSSTPLPPATITPTSTPQPPTVRHHAACWFGPGSAYNLESNITKGKQVQILGVGSLPGWYIIRNPYFLQPCWIQAADLNIDPGMDLSQYPIVTPYPLRTPKP